MTDTIKKSLAATFSSRILAAGLNIVVVPIYLSLLGRESYGLLGIFASLQVLVSFLDFGLGTTLTREFSRLDRSSESKQVMSDLAKASEVVYIAVAGCMTLIFFISVPWIVNHWIQLGDLNSSVAERALLIGGVALAIQWPSNLYYAGLAGLNRQVLISVLTATNATFRVGLTLMALYFIGASVEVFFAVQVVCSVFQVLVARYFMCRELPKSSKFDLCKSRLVAVRRFAGAMTAISICSILFTQLDKIVLSSTLELKDFGLYSLTNSLAAGLYVAISPFFSVIYPKFSALIGSSEKKDILVFYHKSAQLVSFIVVPVAVIFAFFAQMIMFTWTGDLALSDQARWPLIFLILGNSLNGMMNVSYAVQLAADKPKIALYSNICAILFLIPSIYFLATKYGPAGGAFAWFILNVLYASISQYITHRKIFSEGLWRWYASDVGVPVVVSTSICVLFYMFQPDSLSRVESGIYIVVTYLAVCSAAIGSLPLVRAEAAKMLRNRFASRTF